MRLESSCIASIIRLVEFARKWHVVEGTVDVTWEFYSLNLIRCVYCADSRPCQSQPVYRSDSWKSPPKSKDNES